MVRIPDEYQEVEYLESTGTQYIKTNYTPTATEDMKIEMDYMFIVAQTGDSFLFGANASGTSPITFQCEYYNNSRWFCGSGLYQFKSTLGNVGGSLNKRHSFIIDGNVLKIDDNSANSTGMLSNLYSVPLYIFAGNWHEATNFINKGARIYNLSFTANGVKEADFIPCYRKSDSEPGMYDTVTKQFFTNAGTGTFLVGNDVSWDTASLIERRRQILLNSPHLETISDSIASFKTDVSAPLKSCKINFVPIQEGSGDPSPDNVRPITGWDGVTINAGGRNLIHSGIEWFPTKIKPASGKIQGSVYNSFYFSVPKGILYFYKIGREFAYGCFTDEPPTIGTSCYGQLGLTNYYDRIFDNSAGHKYIVLFGPSGTISETVYDFCVRNKTYVGIETWAVSEPYPPDVPASSITIPFPKTIYGGYVDLVRGEVVETDYLLAVDENTVPYNVRRNTGGRVVGYYNLPYAGIKDAFTYYSHGQCIKSTTATYNYQVAGCAANEPYNSDAVRAAISASSDITTVEQYSNWIASVAPLQIAYKLATPITHQLTPQTIKTLKGINNIWSNANGNIEIKFWKH